MPWNAPPVPVLGDPANFRARIGPYLQWLADLDAADFFDVQVSAVDNTVGKVLKVGAFGLGGAAVLAPNADLNDIVSSGLYQADSTTGNRPPNISNGVVLHISRTAAIHVQVAISRSDSNPGEMSTRAKGSGGNWSAWQTVYDQGRVLGTVSQSGGMPTGALIERGSNANGDYIRFADGTQICTHIVAATYYSASRLLASWTHPAVFVGLPIVTPTMRARDAANVADGVAITSGTSAYANSIASGSSNSFVVGSGFVSGDSLWLSMTAIGRWF